MGGRRWTLTKLKPRLNGGYYRANKEPSHTKIDHHIYLDNGIVGFEELSEIFFCHTEKIRKMFYRTGIIKMKGKKGCKIYFDREETIKILSKYVNGHGQLQQIKMHK